MCYTFISLYKDGNLDTWRRAPRPSALGNSGQSNVQALAFFIIKKSNESIFIAKIIVKINAVQYNKSYKKMTLKRRVNSLNYFRESIFGESRYNTMN